MRTLENIEKDIRKYETQYNKRLKLLAKLRRELVPFEARKAILWDKLGKKEFSLDEIKEYAKLRKELPKKRLLIAKHKKALEDVEGRIDKLWLERDEWKEAEIPEILEIPEEVELVVAAVKPSRPKIELIEIDDGSGYIIHYDSVKKMYFLVPEGQRVIAEKYFSTLQIYLNYTFDTGKRVFMMQDPLDETKIIPGRQNPERLHAEMRIILTVRGIGKKAMETLVEATRKSFEEYISEVFGAGRVSHVVPIFEVVDNTGIEEYPRKQKQISKLKQALPGLLKVGRYCRLSDAEPNIDIEKETAKLDYYAEWKDDVKPGYGGDWTRAGWRNLTELDLARQLEGDYVPRVEIEKARMPFDDFNLGTYFRMRDRWHETRSLKDGKRVKVMLSVWEQLKKLKEE